MKRILIPTDFSPNAMKAVTYAAEIAKKNGAQIFLLHVIEPRAVSIGEIDIPLYSRYVEELGNPGLKELETISETIAQFYPGIQVEKKVIEGGIVVSIDNYASENKIDLIVMGTRGVSGLKEMFIGSVAARTIQAVHVPVLAIPDQYIMADPDKILFATNHFERDTNLLHGIIDIATLFSMSIIISVFIDEDHAENNDYITETDHLTTYLKFLKETFPSVRFESQILAGDKFEDTIAKYEEEKGVDMIAMITYPKSFWERLMNISVTKKMAFHSKIPLLTIPVN